MDGTRLFSSPTMSTLRDMEGWMDGCVNRVAIGKPIPKGNIQGTTTWNREQLEKSDHYLNVLVTKVASSLWCCPLMDTTKMGKADKITESICIQCQSNRAHVKSENTLAHPFLALFFSLFVSLDGWCAVTPAVRIQEKVVPLKTISLSLSLSLSPPYSL